MYSRLFLGSAFSRFSSFIKSLNLVDRTEVNGDNVDLRTALTSAVFLLIGLFVVHSVQCGQSSFSSVEGVADDGSKLVLHDCSREF